MLEIRNLTLKTECLKCQNIGRSSPVGLKCKALTLGELCLIPEPHRISLPLYMADLINDAPLNPSKTSMFIIIFCELVVLNFRLTPPYLKSTSYLHRESARPPHVGHRSLRERSRSSRHLEGGAGEIRSDIPSEGDRSLAGRVLQRRVGSYFQA